MTFCEDICEVRDRRRVGKGSRRSKRIEINIDALTMLAKCIDSALPAYEFRCLIPPFASGPRTAAHLLRSSGRVNSMSSIF